MELSLFIIWGAYFIGLYFTLFWLLVFLDKGAQDSPQKVLPNHPLVTVIIPAYNEAESIAKTIESVLHLHYPRDRLQIIAVDHGSTDNTGYLMDAYAPRGVIVLHIQRTSRDRKGVAVNAGLSHARGSFVACLDADSYIEPDALHKMLPHFANPAVAAVVPRMFALGTSTLMKKIQWVEYIVTFLYKKLMAHVDCLHVTPGPFTVYRKSFLNKVGNFDPYNLVEDMDMALRLQRHQLKIIQTHDAIVTTETPTTWIEFYRQRNRWYKGGFYNVLKNKDMLFNSKYGEFGLLQMPMMIGSALLSLTVFTIIYYQQIFQPLYHKLLDWYYTGFPFTLSLTTFLQNLHYLDVNYSRLFFIYFVVVIGLVFIITAFRVGNIRLFSKGIRIPVYYFALYPLLIFIIWCGVVKDLLFGRKQTW